MVPTEPFAPVAHGHTKKESVSTCSTLNTTHQTTNVPPYSMRCFVDGRVRLKSMPPDKHQKRLLATFFQDRQRAWRMRIIPNTAGARHWQKLERIRCVLVCALASQMSLLRGMGVTYIGSQHRQCLCSSSRRLLRPPLEHIATLSGQDPL